MQKQEFDTNIYMLSDLSQHESGTESRLRMNFPSVDGARSRGDHSAYGAAAPHDHVAVLPNGS